MSPNELQKFRVAQFGSENSLRPFPAPVSLNIFARLLFALKKI